MNLPKTLILDVTAEDIFSGLEGNCAACPLALAARRSLAGLGLVPHVGYASRKEGMITAVFISGCKGYYPLSCRARRFMLAFDLGEPVQPARFRLRLEEGE